MKATERLWLTVKRDRVVPEGDPAAAFLWKTPGKEISAAEMKQFGITEPKKAKEEPVPEPEPEEEEAETKAVDSPPENKAVEEPPATRGRRARS